MNARHDALSADELAAIRVYAADHGRRWKDALQESWMNAGDHLRQSDGWALQRLRNRLGPSWLASFTLTPPNRSATPRRKQIDPRAEYLSRTLAADQIGLGTKIICNGFPMTVTEVCDGALKGMAVCRGRGGTVCVSIAELVRFQHNIDDRAFA